jgi:hypothetical protein
MRILPLKHVARVGRSGVLAVCMATALSLAVPIGTAQAATTPSTTKAAAGSGHAASATTPTKPAKSSTKTVTKPTVPVKARQTTELSAEQARAARASAAMAAVHSDVADTCSGQISPDTIYPCSTPSSSGTDVFTVTVPDATDVLIIQALSTSGNTLGYTVTAPGGAAVTCQSGCITDAVGTYTLQVQNQSSAYTLDYTALLSDTTCAMANPSFATGVLQGSVAAGSVGSCYTLGMASAHVLHAYVAGTTWGEMSDTVYDSTGTEICVDDQGDCTLTGTAPYRVLVSDLYGRANTYYTTLYDVTDPLGCLTVAQQTYGTVPDQSSSIQCRTLDVATAGGYQVYAVSSGYSGITGTLYNPDGTAACTNSGSTCQLAAGTYDFVTLEDPEYASALGVVFIAAKETRGCTATGDTDFASGPATGTFAGLGEEVCLTLPSASGKSIYVFNQQTAVGANLAQAEIIDATGAPQCPSADFADATCALTGTAPFYAVLSAPAATGGYRFLVQETDSTAGCTVWPQSGFGGSAGVTETITPVSDVACLSIPANQHSTGEMIDYADTSNTENGGIAVNDPNGKQVCLDLTTVVCSYTSGVAYTALLSSTLGDTYQLVRRDVSKTATCSAPASTAVGGPSTPYVLTSDLYAVCERVTAPAGDKMWFGVRTQAPSPATAALEVTDPTGKELCRQWGIPCELTGSTSYQVIVIASGYAGVSIAAHVDSWIVGTASGWASQCAAHQLSSSGWAPVSGTLSESSTAYCAVVAPVSGEQFAAYGAVGANGSGPIPYVIATSSANWGAADQPCAGSDGFIYCQTSNLGTAPAVLLITPGESTSVPTPVPYLIQGVCQLSCPTHPAAPTISSITPSSGAAGSHQLVVNGTNLNLGTTLRLDSDGAPTGVYGSPVSVNAAGTALTMLINTAGITPGSYDADLDGAGYTSGTPSQGYLPGAYTVTAAPAAVAGGFVPLNTVRILDTRKGLGAPEARVGAGDQVTLKVAGVGGVPASGASAVLVNVTAVDSTAAGIIAVYPDGETRPSSSTVNFGKDDVVANLAVVSLVDGKIDLYNGGSAPVDILADVSGYYTASTSSPGSMLTTVSPARILDTATGVGAAKAQVAHGATVKLGVLGVGGVPSTGVSAVLVNVTATGPTASGYLAAYPDSLAAPEVSTLNFVAGQTVSNQAYVKVIDGKIDVVNGESSGETNVIVDVLGYFSASGSLFQPENTVRVLDTRSGLGGSGETVVADGAAVLNVMDLPGVPGTVTAVVLNVTVTAAQQAGSLTVYADGTSRPSVPTYSYPVSGTIAGLVTVPVVDGKVDFYNGSSGALQVIADLAGYYLS